MKASKHPYLEFQGELMVLAHRGGSGSGHPENTIPAFEQGVLSGAHSIETDLHVTRDGVLIAAHDAKVDHELIIPRAYASQVAERTADGVALYPRFSDVLEALPRDTKLNLDPKSWKAADALCDLLHARPSLLRRICVGAFFDGRITMLRRQFGDSLCTSMGPREAAIFLSTGRARADVAQLPLNLFGRQIATEGVVMKAQKAGIDLHLWTLNSPEEITQAIELGVNGVVTDEVELAVSLASKM